MSRLRLARNTLLLAATLGTLAAVSVLSAGTSWLFLLLIYAGAILTIRELIRVLIRPDLLTAYRALAIALLAGYFLGPAVAIAGWDFGPRVSPLLLAGPFAFHGYTPSLSLAIGLAYAAVAVLLVADRGSVPARTLRLSEARFTTADAWFVGFASMAVLAAVFVGDLGYMGTRVGANDSVSLLGSLAGTLLPAVVPLSLIIAYNDDGSKWRRAFGVGLFVTLCWILAIQGRRVLIFAVLTTLITVLLRWPTKAVSQRNHTIRSTKRSLYLIGGVALVLVAGVYYFFALRTATYAGGEDAALRARSLLAVKILQKDQHGVFEAASIQASARSGVLPGYLGALLATQAGGRLSGECAVANLITSVPRVLLTQKAVLSSRYSCADERVNATYSLPQIDSPTTLLTQGYADFGWLGAMLYPLLIGGLMQIALKLGRHVRPPSIRVFVFASVLFACLFVEESAAFYLVVVRNLGIVCLLSFPLWMLRSPGVQSRLANLR